MHDGTTDQDYRFGQEDMHLKTGNAEGCQKHDNFWCVEGLLLGICALPAVAGVKLLEQSLGDSLEHLLGEDAQQLPANVQRLEYGPVFVAPCTERHSSYLLQTRVCALCGLNWNPT